MDVPRGGRGGRRELSRPVSGDRGDNVNMNAATSSGPAISVEIDDIQSGALHHRPSPYLGTFVFLRFNDRPAGRKFLGLLFPAVASGLPIASPNQDAWVAVALTWNGLRAL